MNRTCPLLLASLFAAPLGCDRPPLFKPGVTPGGPAGVLSGTVTYSGPLPCTELGHVVGAGIVLAFDVRALPPPTGTGTSAASVNTVPGDVLFQGVMDQLVFRDDGSRWCPSFDSPDVSVSADWILSPMLPAAYQIRGFYDHDGDFDPAFKISNLPSKGDIGGGAIANIADVLVGAPVEYAVIEVGDKQADGTYTMPEDGVFIPNIPVNYALKLPFERPIWHYQEVINVTPYDAGDPLNPKLPSDFALATFNVADPVNTENSFIRLRLAAGVLAEEIEPALEPPFGFPVADPDAVIMITRQDTDNDGDIDADDHIPESTTLKALYPLAVFSKLASPLVSQKGPAVILRAATLLEGLIGTASAPDNLMLPSPSLVIALRPSAVCIPADPAAPAVLLISNPTDAMGNPVIADLDPVLAALEVQLGRPVEVMTGCLPEGDYALNLIYGTGQAWTVPNEAGVCAPTEDATVDGMCGDRARLSSQSLVLTVSPPLDPAYCVANPTPAVCLLPPE